MRALLLIALVHGFSNVSLAQMIRFDLSMPFSDVRQLLPPDGQVIDIEREMNAFPNEQGEDRDAWIQISPGKRLRARENDRNAANEPLIGSGITAQHGFIELNLGWRIHRNLGFETHFDGTLTARADVSLANGQWKVQFKEFQLHWERLPLVPNIAALAEPIIQAAVASTLTEMLNKYTQDLAKQMPGLKVRLPDICGTVVDDKLVFTTTKLARVVGLGPGQAAPATVGKLQLGVIDNASVDASQVIAISNIEVSGKIDGRSMVRLRAAPGATLVFRDKIDGQSTVYIDAPGCHIEFHGEINGQSHLHIRAKSAVFHKKIDGGWIDKDQNGDRRITTVNIEFSEGGWVSCPELCAHLNWNKASPNLNNPRISIGKTHWAGRVEAR